MRGGLDSRAGRRPPDSLALIKALLAAGVNPNPQLAFKEPSRGGRDNRFRDDLLTTGATPLLRAAQTFDNEVVGAAARARRAGRSAERVRRDAVHGRGRHRHARRRAACSVPGTPDNVVALSLETMEILRQAGADVNARITDVTSLTARIARTNTMTGRQGQTALFLAADIGTDRGGPLSARARRSAGV